MQSVVQINTITLEDQLSHGSIVSVADNICDDTTTLARPPHGPLSSVMSSALASLARHVQRDIEEAADGHAEEARRWRECDEVIEMVEEQLQAEAENATREFEEADEANEIERLKYCESLALKIQVQEEEEGYSHGYGYGCGHGHG